MIDHIRTSRFLTPTALSRTVWGGMLLLHGPIFGLVCLSLFREGLEFSRLWSALALAAALAFFALKLRDVSFLRIRNTQVGWIAFLLIVTLVHQGALVRHLGDEQAIPATLATVVTIGTIAAGREAWRKRRVLRDWGELLAASAARSDILRATGPAEASPARVPACGFPVVDVGPRAPPPTSD